MNFRTRVILTVVLACVACTVGAVLVASVKARSSGEDALKDKSRAIISRLEAARHFIATQGILEQTIDRAVAVYPDGNIPAETQAEIMKAVPIVASMQIGKKDSADEHYTFRVPAFDPRNPNNEPKEFEAQYLREFEANPELTEAFHIDEDNNTLSVMRPIRLNAEEGCLACHGAKSTSPWGNGKDVLGYEMEGWEDGSVHGMFAVTMDLAPLDQEIFSTITEMALWGAGILLACVLTALVFVSAPLKHFLSTIADTVERLVNSSEEVNESANQIASGSSSLAQGATEQAASLEETAATLEEIASLSGHNADHSKSARQLSEQVTETADTAGSAMEEMAASVRSIKDASDEIQDIIKTIDEIAFQTNLLALNAAVEAARAGEAGKGFAVVAEEVRNLARRSADAARDTTEKITRSVTLADEGVEVSSRVHESLKEVRMNAAKAAGIIEDIAAASAEQTTGLSQITIAMTELDQVTQSNAALAEQSSGAAHQLQAQVKTVHDSIEALQGILGEDRSRNR